jgi:uncharacterized protein (DUF924 family)
MDAADETGWREAVLGFWFPPGMEADDEAAHARRFQRWFGGGTNAGLPRFAPVLAAALAGRLDGWAATPRGRLALVVVLDQFPRGLHAGTPATFAGDPAALRLAEEGLARGEHAALAWPWERTFLFLPLAHAEGPDHLARLDRAAALADAVAEEAPPALRGIYRFSAGQARGHREVIARFGRYPHRNAVLGRPSTPEEEAYLARGEFVHRRAPPGAAAPV